MLHLYCVIHFFHLQVYINYFSLLWTMAHFSPRNLPLIVRGFVTDLEDPALLLCLKMHHLQEFYLAEKVFDWELDILTELTADYFEIRQECLKAYPSCFKSIKPKHHNITHYPSLVRSFGPLLAYWTGRFESRHRIPVNVMGGSKCFRNSALSIGNDCELLIFYFFRYFVTNLEFSSI